jgi:Skp family chaperone for outer membrane proteins
MKKILALALLGLAPVLVAAAVPAYAAGDPPAPKIVVLDRLAIMQGSKAGQDIARQVQAIAAQAKRDLQAQGEALQSEGRALQQQVAILSPDLKQKRIAAFQAKEAALQAAAGKKDEQIKAGFYQARQQLEAQVGPILQEVVKERGANMVLDKQAVVSASVGGYDITKEVIDKLDAKVSTIKVNLNAPPLPAGAVRQ